MDNLKNENSTTFWNEGIKIEVYVTHQSVESKSPYQQHHFFEQQYYNDFATETGVNQALGRVPHKNSGINS